MSTFAVTVEQIEVLPHPGADRLELARVGEYRAVVEKGRYVTGDFALYIPEQAILPDELIAELGLDNKLAGSNKNRVKAVRLRGEISQGIVCRPSSMDWNGDVTALLGIDWAELLGIYKWEPPIPVHLAGEVDSCGELIRWPDIENIKRYPEIFTPGEEVYLTEKIHGTCCLITYVAESELFVVSSKGLGGKNLVLKENDNNVYWRAVKKYKLREKLAQLCREEGWSKVGLFGEVYGAGIQDLNYGVNTSMEGPGYAGFDIWRHSLVDGAAGFCNAPDTLKFLDRSKIPAVPAVYEGPWDYAFACSLAEVMEDVSGTESCIREGLVIRSATEEISAVTGGRKIAKLVSEQYLLRKNGTEYE